MIVIKANISGDSATAFGPTVELCSLHFHSFPVIGSGQSAHWRIILNTISLDNALRLPVLHDSLRLVSLYLKSVSNGSKL